MLKIDRATMDEIRAQAAQAWPEECCGALLGLPVAEGWHVCLAISAANASPDPLCHYRIAAHELVRTEREARAQGLEIAGFYHSHPDAPAVPSPADLDEANWPGCSYLILSVENGASVQARSYRLSLSDAGEKAFHEEPVVIQPAGPSAASDGKIEGERFR